MKKVKVVIIGAGSSGLAARREVAKQTDDYLVVNSGPLGTTCARVGCMPSKVLIQAANDFYRRKSWAEQGIEGGADLHIDPVKVLEHVRSLRDRFVRGVTGSMESWQGEKLISKRATFVDANTLDCEGELIKADKIIIATGSRPSIPRDYEEFKEFLVTTDEVFEMKKLPKSVAVIGLGVIGLELGQALHRLGVEVYGIARRESLAGISDPEIKRYAIDKFSEEMNLSFEGVKSMKREGSLLVMDIGDKEIKVEKVLLTAGRKTNWDGLGLTKLGLEEGAVPKFNSATFQLTEHPHIFIAGDITGENQILHEASDEGRVAGYNAVNDITEFELRCSLRITFTDPNIASSGMTYLELQKSHADFEVGKVSFEGQGRSIVKLKEIGLLHVYGDKKTGLLLGAEMYGPDTEHIAHLLSWAIAMKMTVNKVLSMPIYHPVIEEGLRTALRDLRSKVNEEQPILEIFPKRK